MSIFQKTSLAERFIEYCLRADSSKERREREAFVYRLVNSDGFQDSVLGRLASDQSRRVTPQQVENAPPATPLPADGVAPDGDEPPELSPAREDPERTWRDSETEAEMDAARRRSFDNGSPTRVREYDPF